MGYPPRQCSYCVRSLVTNHFFTSGNVIFDENIPYNALHSIPAISHDYSLLPFLDHHHSNSVSTSTSNNPPVTVHPPNPSNLDNLDEPTLEQHIFDTMPALELSTGSSPPVTPPGSQLLVQPATPMPVQMQSHSHTQKLTEKGKLFGEEVEKGKTHLVNIRASAAQRREGETGRQRSDDGRAGDVVEDEAADGGDDPFAVLCNSGIFDSNAQIDSAAMVASLDTEDYLQHDVNSFCEATLLSIRSNVWRNPGVEGYDISIPPANHWEAERQKDAAEWKKVTEKELEDLRSMGVYEDAEALPEGKKAIGCRWVYEFKINQSGGPPLYKAHLVAQGFSQVPFVDYGVTFAPVAKSVTVCFVAVYSALQGWHLQCFDATCAFLHGNLTNEIFMRRPPPLPPGV